MTDRVKGCLVLFDRDIRTDDVEALVAAIRQLRGVSAVNLSLTTPDDWMNRERARQELTDRLWKALAKDEH